MIHENQQLLDLLKPGSVVYVGGSCAEPHGLLDLIEVEGGEKPALVADWLVMCGGKK